MSNGCETFEGRQAIRRYAVDRMTLVFDNDAAISYRLNNAARHAVHEGMGTGVDARQYAEFLDNRNGVPDRSEWASVVGVWVCDEIDTIIEEWGERWPGSDALFMLLKDLLDTSDSTQREMIGNHYLPECIEDVVETLDLCESCYCDICECDDEDDEDSPEGDDEEPEGTPTGYVCGYCSLPIVRTADSRLVHGAGTPDVPPVTSGDYVTGHHRPGGAALPVDMVAPDGE